MKKFHAIALILTCYSASGCSSDSNNADPVTNNTVTNNKTNTATNNKTITATNNSTNIGTNNGTNAATNNGTQPSVDIALFLADGLAEEITTVDCELSGGTETTCYSVTVKGTPASHEVGPFCPTTINDGADKGGLWFKDGELYDISGAFILDLPNFYGDAAWILYDEAGNVNVIDTAEAFQNAARPNVDEQYWYNCVEGRMEWLNDEATINGTVLIPTTPVLADASSTEPIDDHGTVGVSLDGVILSGTAAIDDILAAYTLAAFDDCGGHINPALGYHIHGAHKCSEIEGDVEEGETPMFGYAADGFPIHSPLEIVALDECNGHSTESLGYHYHAEGIEKNAILPCLKGEYVAQAGGGRPPGGGGPGE